MSEGVVHSKEMGIGHKEFFRNIPRAMGDGDYTVNKDGVILEEDGKSLTISIAEETERRIALIVLPVTQVTLTFKGYDDSDVTAFLEGFDRAFQRGGG